VYLFVLSSQSFRFSHSTDRIFRPKQALLSFLSLYQVTRDKIIEDWHWSEPNLDFSDDRGYGSGYPGDERCKKWLETNIDSVFGFPDICRFSWGTTKELLKGGAVKRVDW